jgi:ketosteroid isomerase-like protein
MTEDQTSAQLRELDSSIDALATQGHWDKLAALLADDFRYNHSTGLSQSRTEWIDGLKPLVGRRDRVPSSIQIELHGDIAVAMGDVDIVWKDGRHAYDRYVRVYRRGGDGHWRAISQRTLPAHDRAPTGS